MRLYTVGNMSRLAVIGDYWRNIVRESWRMWRFVIFG